ncbi:MAG: helix-turn-helix domain-containing protein [Prevotellaceae bacterium]|jgi:transcriptional regulator with XRE-family HTH domain|nr:helix-turn-helix domain-containing protein [Prevotellaceae bacterium]
MIDIKALRKAKKMTQQEFAELLGCDQSFISQIEGGKRPLPEEYVERLTENFGNNLDEHKLVKKNPASEILQKANINFDSIMLVPLVSQYAYAGYLSGFGDEEYTDSLPTVPWYVDREYKGKYMFFEVRGDSMNDGSIASYPEGSRLLARNVCHEHWGSRLPVNAWDFVIVHRNEGILAKRIVEHNVGEGTITCHSLNLLYADFVLRLNDVFELYTIVQKVIPAKR